MTMRCDVMLCNFPTLFELPTWQSAELGVTQHSSSSRKLSNFVRRTGEKRGNVVKCLSLAANILQQNGSGHGAV